MAKPHPRRGEVFRAARRNSDLVNQMASQHIVDVPVNKSVCFLQVLQRNLLVVLLLHQVHLYGVTEFPQKQLQALQHRFL